jgi:phosphoenolpyruvate carboxylase
LSLLYHGLLCNASLIITAMEESDLLENYENFDGETRAAWQQAMLLSIPGIAAAMRSTG